MRRLIILFCCLLAHYMARGQTADEWRYWFDEDPQYTYVAHELEDGTFDIDVSALPEGLHSLHLQALKDETLSAPVTRLFTKAPQASESFKGLLYLDGHLMTDATTTMNDGKLLYDFDVSSLSPGLHIYEVKACSPSGIVTTSVSGMFVRDLTTTEQRTMSCAFSIDNGDVVMQTGTIADGVYHYDLDVSQIADGIHEINYWLLADNGVTTNRGSAFFLKSSSTEGSTMRCFYTLDNNSTTPMEGALSDGILKFDLDVSQVSDGLHCITYWLVNENDASTTPQSAYFIKIPEGGTGIIEYEYWLNDDFENRRTITLNERVDPLVLLEQLSFDPQEFRLSAFQLSFDDGVPSMVAENDLHMRFTDVGGRMTDMKATFSDGRVSQPILDIIPVEIQHTVEAPSPYSGELRWFSAEVNEGDSILFRSSEPGTMMVFSPLGKMVHIASGSQVTDFSGFRAQLSGTYYVALHSMTSNSSTVKLTYRDYDKPGIGDLNGDTNVIVADVMLTVSYILGKENITADIWNADMNIDHKISVADVMAIVRIILGQ